MSLFLHFDHALTSIFGLKWLLVVLTGCSVRGSTLGGMSGGRLLPVAKGSARKPKPGPGRFSGCDGVLPKGASKAPGFCSEACRARQWR
ncbi:hypothetical protein ACTOB_004024 [Actinoplanes oblitus]|uniref:FLZ-type domain-containing protein n=1 Tax=Actinoplanes oblitus TaxID=3040509 RepID=A0ABY8WQY1_9ACTN|nr:hypothetical protein [Actinoplanes oblitus]WIN00325.1 hypothetical protein ACTOB_004024 [Actinoplanes oblitus]